MTSSEQWPTPEALAKEAISEFFTEGDIYLIFFGQLISAVSGSTVNNDFIVRSFGKSPEAVLADAFALAVFLCSDKVFDYGHSERWADDSFHYIEGDSRETFAELAIQKFEQCNDLNDVDLLYKTWLIKNKKGARAPSRIPDDVIGLFGPNQEADGTSSR